MNEVKVNCVMCLAEPQPLQRYITVDTTTNSETIITHALLANLTGQRVDWEGQPSDLPMPCSNCSKLSDQFSKNDSVSGSAVCRPHPLTGVHLYVWIHGYALLHTVHCAYHNYSCYMYPSFILLPTSFSLSHPLSPISPFSHPLLSHPFPHSPIPSHPFPHSPIPSPLPHSTILPSPLTHSPILPSPLLSPIPRFSHHLSPIPPFPDSPSSSQQVTVVQMQYNGSADMCYCVKSYVHYHTAVSPAFHLEDYSSREYSTWVESRYMQNT